LFSEGIVQNGDEFKLGDTSICTWLIILISIVNAFLPMDKINEYLFPVRSAADLTKPYSEVEADFDVVLQTKILFFILKLKIQKIIFFFKDYDRENPVYKKDSIKKWLD